MDLFDVIKGREPFDLTFKSFWLMPQAVLLVFHALLLLILVINTSAEEFTQAMNCANCAAETKVVYHHEFSQRLVNVYWLSLLFPIIHHVLFDWGVVRSLVAVLRSSGRSTPILKDLVYQVIAPSIILASLFYYGFEIGLGLHDFMWETS